jgi:long-chain acyl-CoA synthetase
MERIWLKHYPAGVPADVAVDALPSLVELLEDSFARYATRSCCKFMGQAHSFAQIEEASRHFAAYLQALGLQPGDRVAVMLPNVPQYVVAVAGILRAGLVVVNVNPLYTPRELHHQLLDSQAQALILLDNFAATFEAVAAEVPVRHVVLTGLGDMLGWFRGWLVNTVVRHVRKLVPAYQLPRATRWSAAMARGRGAPFSPVHPGPDDLAVLQYTGGTTGTSKGAMLLHRHLVANVLQCEAWYQPALRHIPPGEQIVTVCALPLYHIFGFNTNLMLSLRMGGCNLLIANPRDLPGLLKTLATEPFHSFPAVNTLFNAIVHHPDCAKVNWRRLKISIGGGSSVQQATARLWQEKTGCPIWEGYGLSETSPVVACNPVDKDVFTGAIGLPLPNTELRLLDDDGRDVPFGQPGEIAVRGPQLMAGYWRRPEETAAVTTADGFFRTGDIGVMDERGFFRIVDRKKDMVLVSGFNVYPNEVEDVVTQLPGVRECAAIGVPDEHSGEAVKVVIVKRDPALTEADVRRWCHDNLTGYKRPKWIEFKDELPKTPVGKVLRRLLRQPSASQ